VTSSSAATVATTAARVSAEFIDGAAGRILLTHWAAVPPAICTVMIVAPFVDEMNKSRRVLALAAMRLAEHGLNVVLPDPYGTGDSEGEFRDATLERWRHDLDLAYAHVASSGAPVVGLLTLRTGALLAAHWLRESGHRVRATAMWQPQASGEQWIAQLLRIRITASMMSDRRETPQQLMDSMRREGHVEVAGYELGADLAQGIEALRLADLATPALGSTHIFEVARREPLQLGGAMSDLKTKLGASGVVADATAVAGDVFWSSTEIVVNAELVSQTVDWLTAQVAA
jgi:exosortase A-associated hydrolase 2